MQCVIAAVQAEDARAVVAAKEAHEAKREKLRNDNQEQINELRISLDNRIDDLETKFDDANTVYHDQTAERNREYYELAQWDKQLTDKIRARKRRVGKGGSLGGYDGRGLGRRAEGMGGREGKRSEG